MATNIFINEIHYDNVGTDIGEAIEIAGLAGLDLFGWSLVLYNGVSSSRRVYNTLNLSGTFFNQNNGFGTLSFTYPSNGIQNGDPDGIALVDNLGNVVQFLSYGGTFTALDGPAIGLTSTSIGVSENSGTPVGASLQLTGTGTTATDFTWTVSTTNTFGTVNTGQTFTGGVTPPPTIIINEIDSDQTGTDAAEFIELYDGGVGNSSLDGLVLVLYNGSTDTVYRAIDLDGFITDSNGFFVVGSANVPNVDFLAFTTNGLQNGADAVALYRANASDFSNGTAITTTNLIDAIVYDNNNGDDSGLLPLLNAGQPQVDENANGSGTTQSLQRITNGSGGTRNTNTYQALTPTPGTANIIPPPPVNITRIYDIQGAGHISTFNNQTVTTKGIVTAVDTNGFYLQDATGDGNINTSDGIFVFTNSAPTVSIGDELEVQGTVNEFTPGGTSTGNLSITQIINSTITTLSRGNALPAATIIGLNGRIPPNTIIDNDNFAVFDPQQDGIDFYESLEGTLVTIQDAISVAPTTSFSEIFVSANRGASATGLNSNGGLTINDTNPNITPTSLGDIDFNPERIQIDDLRNSGVIPSVTTGTLLGDITGVVSYSFGNYEVLIDTPLNPVVGTGIQQGETTTILGGSERLTIASYNVLNLDPNDGDGDTDVADGRFNAIAAQIVNNLQTPDIIGLQEVQDNDGSVNSNITSASLTLQTLVNAIAAAGGPQYQFIDNPFIGDDTNGGQPGGNIRTAYLYNPNRVSFVQGSLQTTTNPTDQQTNVNNAFYASRLPLAATFSFNAENVTVVNNHFTSRGGSDPLVGVNQPPTIGGEQERLNQAQSVRDFANNLLTNNPTANLVVLGDLNGFQFESYQQEILQGSATEPKLTNLNNTLTASEAYSYIFEGNSQALDHIFVSDRLLDNVQYDSVHVNADFVETPQRASDHDPVVAGLFIPIPENIINGTTRRDNLIGTSGNDVITGFQGQDTITTGAGKDRIVYTSVNDGGDTITDFSVGNDKIVLTQVLQSVGYKGSNPITDGYVRFLAQGSNTIVQFDPDGLNGTGLPRSFISVQNVSVTDLNNVNNFIL